MELKDLEGVPVPNRWNKNCLKWGEKKKKSCRILVEASKIIVKIRREPNQRSFVGSLDNHAVISATASCGSSDWNTEAQNKK